MSTNDDTAAERTQTVSIIVPVYNAAPYLDQALASAEAQRHRAIEIVCVNDGSTDGSPAILRNHAARDPRIRVIDQENRGYGAAMNAGIAAAGGDWIAILEPDDWIEPDMLGDLLSRARELSRPGRPVDIAKSPYWIVRDPDTPRQQKLPCSYKGRVRPRRQPFLAADAPQLLGHHPSIWSAIYRAEFLREHGIRFREIPGAGWADNPFLVETLCQARAICYVDRAFYCYREETPEKAAALSKRTPMMPLDRWEDMADVLDRLKVADPAIWREQTYRAFTYQRLARGGAPFDACAPEVRAGIERMFSRIDPRLAFSDPRVPPEDKRLFARIRGIDLPRGAASSMPYRAYLLREGAYNMVNRGPRATLRMLARFLKK